ncbi:MAG: DUF952 domain-containing protein [Acidimicrobiales bacterium]
MDGPKSGQADRGGSVPDPRSVRIFHITTPVAALELAEHGELRPPSLAAEGFIHCSTAGQVVDSTRRYLEGVDDLVLVELDPVGLGETLRWFESYPGQWFPHIHGPIVADQVLGVHPWRPDDRSRWIL